MKNTHKNEKTLDPDDWDEFQALLHKVCDDMVDYLKTVGDRPVWSELPEDSKNFLLRICQQQDQDMPMSTMK